MKDQFMSIPGFEGYAAPTADPNRLPDLRPTASELRLASGFPNDSELMHEWLGTGGGRIVLHSLVEGDERYGDPTWREGHVENPDGAVIVGFEYRAQLPGPLSEAAFRALGWLMGEKVQARGFLSGRVNPA